MYDHGNAGKCEGDLYSPDRFGNALCDFHRRRFTTPTWDHVDELVAMNKTTQEVWREASSRLRDLGYVIATQVVKLITAILKRILRRIERR